MSSARPQIHLIAGPNGAGKTTYAFRHIRAVAGTAQFVNLDEIARGLSPLEPESSGQRAARVALEMTADFIKDRISFSIETMLAGRTHLRTLASARAAGFKTVLLYFSPSCVDTCLARIARRVSEGGHSVPEEDVRRRYLCSAANLPEYAGQCDLWRVYDVNTLRVTTAAEGRGNCVAANQPDARVAPAVRKWIDSLPPCAEE